MERTPSHKLWLMISDKHARFKILGKQIKQDKNQFLRGHFVCTRMCKTSKLGGDDGLKMYILKAHQLAE